MMEKVGRNRNRFFPWFLLLMGGSQAVPNRSFSICSCELRWERSSKWSWNVPASLGKPKNWARGRLNPKCASDQ